MQEAVEALDNLAQHPETTPYMKQLDVVPKILKAMEDNPDNEQIQVRDGEGKAKLFLFSFSSHSTRVIKRAGGKKLFGRGNGTGLESRMLTIKFCCFVFPLLFNLKTA